MKRLWTPWRMAYIKGEERTAGCFLCEGPDAGDDEASLIVARAEHAYVILNKFPYNSGHLMIAPYRHTGEYESLTSQEHADLTRLTVAAMRAMHETMAPHGFNLGVNQGIAAGAGVPDHVHLHVVPRWGGDTNFTVTVGETKVLPEALEQTYAKLKPHFSL